MQQPEPDITPSAELSSGEAARKTEARPTVRAESLAACASAVGAIASAVVAAYALTYISHQEQIARDQLQATYLTNLYNKQIEYMASMLSDIDKIWLMSERDITVGTALMTEKEAKEQQQTLKTRAFEYKQMQYELLASAKALSLITPPILRTTLDQPEVTTALIYELIEDFSEAAYTPDGLEKFTSSVRPQLDLLLKWNAVVSGCAQGALSQGKTIDEQHVRSCGIDAELQQWKERSKRKIK